MRYKSFIGLTIENDVGDIGFLCKAKNGSVQALPVPLKSGSIQRSEFIREAVSVQQSFCLRYKALKSIMIPNYPETSPLSLPMRDTLHPLFQKLPDGISEFTFANLYLFRQTHLYNICHFGDAFVITGIDDGAPFFMLPFGLLNKEQLADLFKNYKDKCHLKSKNLLCY